MKLGAILNHFTVPQPDRFLCETRDLWVVRHQYERRSGVGIQFEHDVNHRPACLRVQISRGLVGEKDKGLVNERPRQRDALLFAAGQLSRKMRNALREPDAFKEFQPLLSGSPVAAQFHRHGDVF